MTAPARHAAALLAAIPCLAPAPAHAQTNAWRVDSAAVTFEVRNAGFPVRGTFDELDARVCFDPDHPQHGHLAGSIDPASVNTGIGIRDRHLRRHGWFDVARYGTIEMRSTRLKRTERGFAGTFQLRIRDVVREVEVPFEFTRTGRQARLSGSLTLDRLDYGVGEKSLVLANEVRIEVSLTLTRSGPCGNPP